MKIRKVALALLVVPCLSFAKGNLRKFIAEKSKTSDLRSYRAMYKAVPDSELVAELLSVDKDPGNLDTQSVNRVRKYGLSYEVIERVERNPKLGFDVSRLVDSDTASQATKALVLKNFWKYRKKGGELYEDEAFLRNVYKRNRLEAPNRRRLLKLLRTSTRQNIDFFRGIIDSTSDEDDVFLSVNQLGKMPDGVNETRRKEVSEEINNMLKQKYLDKRIKINQLACARSFAESKVGASFLRNELEKNEFRDWGAVVWAINDQYDFSFARKILNSEKKNNSSWRESEVLRRVSLVGLNSFSESEFLHSDAEKIDYLHLYGLTHGAGLNEKLDSITVRLLNDPNDTVRYAAVEAAFLSLKSKEAILPKIYQTEPSDRIRGFIFQYGLSQ